MFWGITIVFITFSLGQCVQGLNCYQCVDFSMKSSVPSANSRLSKLPHDQACRDDDRSRMKSAPCQGQFGQEMRCIKTYVEESALYYGFTITGQIVARSCVPIVASSPKGCTTSTDLSKVQEAIKVPGLTVTTFSGTVCVCSSDNCNGQATVFPAIVTSLICLALSLNFIVVS